MTSSMESDLQILKLLEDTAPFYHGRPLLSLEHRMYFDTPICTLFYIHRDRPKLSRSSPFYASSKQCLAISAGNV